MSDGRDILRFVAFLVSLIGAFALFIVYPIHIKNEREYREKELIKLFGSGKTVVCGGGYSESYLVSKERGWSLDMKREYFIKDDLMQPLKLCEVR